LQITHYGAIALLNQPRDPQSPAYLMLGLPESLIDDSNPASTLFQTCLIPFERQNAVPEQYRKEPEGGISDLDRQIRDSMFYGRIPTEVVLPKNTEGRDDIKGMSGGPVFMFVPKGEQLWYWVVALQSSWFPDSRVTCAMPIPDIGHLMMSFLEDLRRDSQSS
jgi:hypothetical protein